MNVEKPKLIVIAGPNGSGKTSVTGKIIMAAKLREKCLSNREGVLFETVLSAIDKLD